MASASPNEFEEQSCSDGYSSASDSEDESDSDGHLEEASSIPTSGHYEVEPCRYYNSGHCRKGKNCPYLHFCKYALSGSCRYGSSCRLKHPSNGRAANGGNSRDEDRSLSAETKLTDGRYYQWQLDDGKGWNDIENDHIIEAQYCLPNTKGIKIYNTHYGAVSIDYKKMKVFGKSLRVRRLDDGKTEWLWYCSFRRKWVEYGAKDSKGNPSPANSSDIEKKFQSNPASSFSFSIGSDTFDIRFREMRQVSANKKRKVVRRPKYRAPQAGAGASSLAPTSQRLSLGKKAPAQSPQWQFEGNSGKWHMFKHRQAGTQNECSLSSSDIESKYQQNPNGTILFTVKGQSYKLDFGVFPAFPYSYTEYEEEEEDYFQGTSSQSAPVSGKYYEWQLSDGRQWLRIDNDHVIETHYCQPGAKGITLNTAGPSQVSIDFDKLETQNGAVRVQRLTFLPQGQVEEIGWYFRDDKIWCEYGSKGTSRFPSSVSSKDVEKQFALTPRGTFRFTVGSTSYTLDFSTMTQTNSHTGMRRKVRRRPKLQSTLSHTGSVSSASALPTASSSQLPAPGCKWEFMGDEGVWTEYQAFVCSFDSAAIERQYQQNPRGQIRFSINRYSYTLDFSRMCQVNDNIGTKRAVRRTAVSQQNSWSGSTPRWQFLDIGGTWRDYSSGPSGCSISSQDIEIEYQQNPAGTMTFTTASFSYELDFSAMTQKNLSTNTTRSVQRI